ncbi:MAG: heparinase II/III-family protein [Planctomycetes bacterium]|nr:heparinase II/III-family protein [Planctomycetota bacterium]
MNTWLDTLATVDFCEPCPRPHLLFDAAQVAGVRRRAAEQPGLIQRMRERSNKLLATDARLVPPPLAMWPARDAFYMAEGFLLLEDPALAAWTWTRIEAMLAETTWKFSLHGGCPCCDHVMGNVAAWLSCAHDLLGPAVTEAQTHRLADGLRRHILQPFLDGTRTRAEFWAKAETESNWKIMTCGEAGLAFCAFADYWPEAREALGLATRGVIETLDRVPPEGDWPEGVMYWMTTLFMGLRFALALKRLTNGKVDLFAHPALRRTGDFATMLITPGGRNYDFGDNRADASAENVSLCLLLLGVHTGRGDWLGQARRFPNDSVLWLASDDPAPGPGGVPVQTPARLAALFPRTGVASVRSGWRPDDSFVGFKSGPSNVGHSHLDANSFIVEAAGKPLLIDEGFWWYGPGCFERWRWDFDNCATIGHNTLLVDGKGQTLGADHPGRLTRFESHPRYHLTVGDASACYPGLLKKFIRSWLFIVPDVLIVRDVVACEGERHVEWLMHHAGTVRSDDVLSIVENGNAALTVRPFLLDRTLGWRVADVCRTSLFNAYDLAEEIRPSIRYRAFSPLRPAESFEFLFGMRLGATNDTAFWQFEGAPGDWTLRVASHDLTVRPQADSVTVA